MRMKALIMIPAYNEEENILNVINAIERSSCNTRCQIEYLVINDCSVDRTLDILKEEKKQYVSLPIHLGIGGGVQCGYLYALEKRFDAAIQIDGDGQHDPANLDDILAPLMEKKADVVIGSRFLDKTGFQSSALRRFGIRFLSRLIHWICGADVKDVTSGFRAANSAAIRLFAANYAQDYPEPEAIVLCAKNNLRIKEVPVVMKERQGGKSSISPLKSVYYMIKVSIAIIFTGISKN